MVWSDSGRRSRYQRPPQAATVLISTRRPRPTSYSPPCGVVHCFAGAAAPARACRDRGAYLSFSGTVTYKTAEDLRGAARLTPQDRLLVETDAPFLTPVPHRGRPNASYLVPLTMRFMAEHRGEELGELCRRVESNTFAAFGGRW